MATARWARTARGWSVALVAGLVSAALHASAGGSFPAPAMLALAVLLSGLAGTALIGASMSRLRLTASVAASQLIFHTTFGLPGAGAAPSGPLGSAHAHGAVPPPRIAAAEHAGGHVGPEMLGAHVVAGAITVLLVLHADRALRSMSRPVMLAVRRILAAALPLPRGPRRLPVHRSCVSAPRALRIVPDLTRRGPPASLVAV